MSWSPGVWIQNYDPSKNIMQGMTPFNEIYFHRYLPEEDEEYEEDKEEKGK